MYMVFPLFKMYKYMKINSHSLVSLQNNREPAPCPHHFCNTDFTFCDALFLYAFLNLC